MPPLTWPSTPRLTHPPQDQLAAPRHLLVTPSICCNPIRACSGSAVPTGLPALSLETQSHPGVIDASAAPRLAVAGCSRATSWPCRLFAATHRLQASFHCPQWHDVVLGQSSLRPTRLPWPSQPPLGRTVCRVLAQPRRSITVTHCGPVWRQWHPWTSLACCHAASVSRRRGNPYCDQLSHPWSSWRHRATSWPCRSFAVIRSGRDWGKRCPQAFLYCPR